MSTNMIFLAQGAPMQAQAEQTHAATQQPEPMPNGEPNMYVVGGIILVFVVLLVWLLLPSKKQLPEDSSKALPKDDTKLQQKEEKAKLSLSEIKEAKRENVTAEMSKDELKALRKERRAATQTALAVIEREEKAAEKADENEKTDSDAEKADNAAAKADEKVSETVEKSDKTDSDKKDAETAETVEKSDETNSDDKKESATDEENQSEKKIDIDELTAPIDDILTRSSSAPDDIFASLFGSKDSDNSGLTFDNVEDDTETESAEFPMLGSALISLSEMTKRAQEAGSDADPLAELTKRLSEKAEKKTLNQTQD